MTNTLILYFSRNGANYVNGFVKHLSIGNTEIAATMLQKITDADIFKIEPVTSYSSDYYECISQAKEDLLKGVRPELKAWMDSIALYHIIYLGYPNYWGTMPVAVFSFLERYDFSDKIIKPFCTHEGSGMGRSEKDLRCICPTAIIAPGLPIRGSNVKLAASILEEWCCYTKSG